MTKRDAILDLYWLAGFLEGEGSFSYPRSSRDYAVVSAVSTDKDVATRVARLLGVKMYGPYRYGDNKKPYWSVAQRGSKGAGWMRVLQPLMGRRRQAQIRKTLAHWEASK
jgi:hypothetical protein